MGVVLVSLLRSNESYLVSSFDSCSLCLRSR